MPHHYTPESDLSWRGIVYPAGISATVPDDLAAALGLGSKPKLHPAIDGTGLAQPPALMLINGVDVIREIQAIPTIGPGAAKVILFNRPDGGYRSLEHVWELCPKILQPPYATDPDQIAAWGIDA